MVLLAYCNILYNIRETERNQSHCGSYKQREVCNIIIIYYRIYAARARKFYVVRRWKSQYKTRVQSVNQDSYDCKRVDGRNGENKNEITDKKKIPDVLVCAVPTFFEHYGVIIFLWIQPISWKTDVFGETIIEANTNFTIFILDR